MKKLIATTLAFLVLFPTCACGTNVSREPESDLPFQENSTQTPTPEEPVSPEPETPASPKPEEPASPEPETPVSPEPEEPVSPEPEEPVSPEPQPKTVQYVRVLTDNLNVRAGAGTGFSSLGQADKGVLLALTGRSGNWYETVYRGERAFVSASEKFSEIIRLDSSEEKIERVISEGCRYLGVPYVYGAVRYHDGDGNRIKGFSESCFDCSSLMQYIFYRGAGVLLDMTTRTQVKQGVKVDWEEIKRGDLLFFTNDSRRSLSGIERVGHVALYLGDRYILHTASDYAKIELISAKRQSYFLQARRVL